MANVPNSVKNMTGVDITQILSRTGLTGSRVTILRFNPKYPNPLHQLHQMGAEGALAPCAPSIFWHNQPPPYFNQPLLPTGCGFETDWKRKLGQSHMIFVQKMRMKREEHYSVYRAILRAHGGEGARFLFFGIFWHFFQHFVKIKVAKFGLKLQSQIFLIGPSEKSGIEIKSEYQLTGHPV